MTLTVQESIDALDALFVAKGRTASIHCRPAPPRQTEALSSRTSRSRPWITRDGTKVPLGLRLGSTENAVVCTDLLQDLLARGLTLGGRVLGVIDGGKGLRDDELHRESDRNPAARHAEHQALARGGHAAALARARPAARRRAFPAHQAPWRVGHARDRSRSRDGRGACRVSRRGHHRRKRRGHHWAQERSSEGGRYVAIPCAAVN